jgi:uncharacterized protein YggE
MGMAARNGVSAVIVILVVLVLVMSSATAYLGLVVLARPTGSTGSNLGQNIVVSSLPGGTSAYNIGQTSGQDPTNSITVSGTGLVSYTPNEALLSVSVVSSATTAESASSTNAQAIAKVISSLNSIGIDNKSIETQGYSIYPNYAQGYGGNVVPSIVGYTVTNTLLVNVTSTTSSQLGLKAGEAIDTAVGAGANQVSLQFGATSSLQAQLNTLALQAAISSAQGQAMTIAKSLGVNITGVISAVQGYNPYYGQTSYQYTGAVGAVDSTPIMPGTQYNSASITVVYAID